MGITEANRRWWVLATMAGSLSMIMIDQTVVSVALPSMRRDLDLSPVGAQWVVNVYLLVLAMLVVIGGRLGDLVGPARTFRLGVALFVGASAFCALAVGGASLVLARGLQAAGAALMVPATGAILTNTFAPSERGRAMGIYSGSTMVFLALGPLVGGLLTELFSWRAVFFVNLPVGALTLAFAHVALAGGAGETRSGGRFDWPGAASLVAAIGALVLALMQAQVWGWGSVVTLGAIVVAVAATLAFVLVERRVPEPLVSPALWRKGNTAVDNVVLAALQFALVGLTVFGAIWVQSVLGYGAIAAGLSLLPLTVPLLIVAPLAGRLYDRHGPRLLLAGGTALMGLSLLWLAVMLHTHSFGWIAPGYVGVGVALGLAISPAATDALAAAGREERGEASGVSQMSRQLGGAVGMAVLGAIVGARSSPAAVTTATADAYLVAAVVLFAATGAAWTLLRRQLASDASAPLPTAAVV
ncbi:MFS transporter [Solirubrobacter phytolaccae]|uniref:MFS transporter n=1 Tax=Solirubrobacter phytolaccae TaxID=1404360 RepID=A0A9X3NHG4_9ACTN|nr:MFS transporter [Solirubrobacter phytolaccae]MDA0184031.1 MFS transporter [Solirubrobacter phytolaccae]